jgi:predicted negative regulator of RcsB-dependent stress response
MEKVVYTTTIQFMSRASDFFQNAPKFDGPSLAVGAVLCLVSLSGCHRTPPVTTQGVDVGDAKAASAKIEDADKLWAGREDPDKVRQAVALLRQARIEDYGSFDAAWKLARADYYLGDHTQDDRERENSFREGVEAGREAIKLNDGKPEGHFWLGANYGGSAKYSTLAGLSSVEDIRKEMETVLKLDEGFQSGSAYLVLGQLYLQAPKVLGGDVDKAIENLEKGLKFGPDNALLRVRLAEAYHTARRDSDARKQIDYIMTMKFDPSYAAEYKEAQELAKKLQAELN